MTVDAVILFAVFGLPVALAALLLPRVTREAALTLAPWAPLPALLVALAGAPAGPVVLPWLLLGTELGLDATRRVFLLFTSGLWLAAGVYAAGYHRDDPDRASLFAFHLVTLAGNLGLIVALDAVSFYLAFIVMSFAAFGLVIHTGTDEARRAAIVYLVLVIIGEVMILPGLWLAVTHAPTLALAEVAASAGELGWPVMLLLAAGFAVKAGAVPLHVWLPLAHPVAPTPSSAVLSGAIIKAGLMGWIVFLPLGSGAFPGLSGLFIVAGLLAAFYGAVIGVMQDKPKTVLAYSSISQMGFAAIAVGAGLVMPGASQAALTAVLAYALHHALAKGALFLGVGVVENAGGELRRRRALALLLLPALALAGAPLTSGLVAKTALKSAAYALEGGAALALDWLLPLAAVGTTLLMARFLWLMAHAPGHGARQGLWPPWLATLAAVAVVSWLPVAVTPAVIRQSLTLSSLWEALWPIVVGAGLAVLAVGRLRPWVERLPRIAEGDLLWPLVELGRPLLAWRPIAALDALARARDMALERLEAAQSRLFIALERGAGLLASWSVFGVASLLALLIALALLI